ncbi:MAG TPA: leucyl aminopeptidase, partial [Rhodobacterales bacterium]|nr:leucyl aminopeptidase [Rhodobacterales bacterium]
MPGTIPEMENTMTDILAPTFIPLDIDMLASAEGRIVILSEGGGRMDKGARRINRLTRGALARLVESAQFGEAAPGDSFEMVWPTGMVAEAVQVIKFDRKMNDATARKVGGAIGAKALGQDVLVLAGSLRHTPDIALGAMLRAYDFRDHKSGEAGKAPGGSLTFAVANPEALKAQEADLTAVAEGVFFTRDLVNAPANVLTTQSFADQLEALGALGVKVEVLDEPELEALGMGALLGVGQGSASPSKVLVMEWNGGAEGAAP